MPRVEEEERDNEVEDVGRDQGDDEREEDLVLEEVLEDEDAVCELVLHGFDSDEDGCEEEVARQVSKKSVKWGGKTYIMMTTQKRTIVM